jgi:hypothetical protein
MDVLLGSGYGGFERNSGYARQNMGRKAAGWLIGVSFVGISVMERCPDDPSGVGGLKQPGKCFDIARAHIADHEITQAALTPGLHME